MATTIPKNVEWEGNIYIELSPFTQKTYDTVLITDPADPNYVGSFKDVKKQYFDYLQAKGRGEDVKSPITIKNLSSEHDKNHAITFCKGKDYCGYFENKNVQLSSYNDIYIKSQENETTYNKASSNIQCMINKSIYYNATSGSFFYDEPISYSDTDLQEINKNLPASMVADHFVYIEPAPKINKLFVEIQDKETRECQVSFEYKYNPLETNFETWGNYANFIYVTEGQIECYIKDKDYDEFQEEDMYQIEKGDYFDRFLRRHKDDSDISLNPILEGKFSSCLHFNKSGLNQTNYYAFCDTDKISFKEFKESQDIPLCFLNKRTLNEIKENLSSFDIPDGHTDFDLCIKAFGYNYQNNYESIELIGIEKIEEIFNKLVESGEKSIEVTVDMGENIKHYFDEDITVFNCKDYGDTVGGSFIFRNTEFEFDYDTKTSDITLHKFDYDIEDNETGYYKEKELPALLQNESIQDLLFDQIDLGVNKFIAEQRYGSLDDMLMELEAKATKEPVKSVSKDEPEL